MAARKKKRPLRPRTPSRVKKRTTKKKARARAAHEHPELIGLGLVAVGLFLASLLYLGWEGGVAGEKVEAGLRDVIGSAAYAAPLALVVVGGLMLFRSALLDVKPFRTGLVVTTIGLMVTLGGEHGGAVGERARRRRREAARRHRLRPARPDRAARGRAPAFRRLVRRRAPPLPSRRPSRRRAGRETVSDRRRGRRARRPRSRSTSRRSTSSTTTPTSSPRACPSRSPLLVQPDDETEEQPALFDVPRAGGGVRAAGPRRAQGLAAGGRELEGRRPAHRRHARDRARALRRRGDDRRPDRRPARDPLRAAARARDEGVEGRGAEGRPLLRARDDRDPDPGADPRQAGRRRRGAEPGAEDRHARRHLRRPALEREPARRLARQGHLRQRRLGRPGADAAHPDRGHHRLRQVGLHQHDPDLDPAPLDARTTCG